MGDERARFETARRAGLAAVGVGAGIGTLRERSLHAVLKYWADPDETHHEIPLEGLVADVFDGERVTEIQTRGFSKLRPKLARLLPRYPVTVIYPVAQVKRTAWIDPETGESTPLRRSPKTGRVWDAFAEMYYLRDYLRDYLLGGLRRDAGAGGLELRILYLEIEEYRLLDGWSRDRKRGAHRAERIPVSLLSEQALRSVEDFTALLPCSLEDGFTSAELARALSLRRNRAQQVANILYSIGSIIRMGKSGNAYQYARPASGKASHSVVDLKSI